MNWGEMNQYTTGVGQQLYVHKVNVECFKYNCVIHNPSTHSMSKFPTSWRGDRGLMERICSHGISHPDPDDITFKIRKYGADKMKHEAVHGCDGCCHEH